ncbi:hypothetical protein NL492_27135, partial [Klebsiella pneumoniae]|nr:hypothetical protein [Klebsiella pneumoniae]
SMQLFLQNSQLNLLTFTLKSSTAFICSLIERVQRFLQIPAKLLRFRSTMGILLFGEICLTGRRELVE